MAEQVPVVVREAVTNAWHHSRGSVVDVMVRADADCTVRVVDNGIGIPDADVGGLGLANLTARAVALGGVFSVVARPDTGSDLEWRVPLDGP